MLQDLDFGKMEIEFQEREPSNQAVVVCFRGRDVLLLRAQDDTLTLPQRCRVAEWARQRSWMSWGTEKLRYIFRLQDVDFFLWMGQSGDADDGFCYEPVGKLRQLPSKQVCFAVMTAWHLYCWYRNNRFCGHCGSAMLHDGEERMLRCPACGNMVFPKISPAVIIAVTHGDRLLLSKYAGRAYTHYALLAGYTEIGETLEQTVHREVMEEVGLRVKNIRYYKSQPWGIDGNVLMGFYCDLDGDDAIHLDTKELAFAQWFPRNAIPIRDDGISLTREMIRVFEEGREPGANV